MTRTKKNNAGMVTDRIPAPAIPEHTEEDIAVALLAAEGEFTVCPRCGELAAFTDGDELVCLDCTPIRIS